MIRREFIKFIVGTLAFVPFIKPKKGLSKADVSEVAAQCKKLQKIGSGDGRIWLDESTGFMEFPEAVTGIEKVEDYMVIFCERSVWKMRIDDDGRAVKTLLSSYPERWKMHNYSQRV